jgi:Holliday junction resolvase RusA-like endonuclease
VKPRLSFIVPGRVVPCARPRAMLIRGRIHSYVPSETTDYEQRVALCARAAVARYPDWTSVVARKLPLRVHVHVVRHMWRGDWDNLAKSICDGMGKADVVFTNDNRIVQCLTSLNTDPRAEERAEVMVEPVMGLLQEPLWCTVARENGWGPLGQERTGT